MYTPEEIKRLLYDNLKQYYYNKICNYVQGQLRNNVKLAKIASKIITGVWISPNYQYIKLPPYGSFYHLFECRNIDVNWLYRKPKDTYSSWIDLETLCGQYNVSISIYTSDGFIIPRKLCYIASLPTSSDYITYIAIDNKIEQYINQFAQKDIYLTIYLDTSLENDIEVYGYIPHVSDLNYLTYIINKYNSYPNKDKVSLFINGIYYHSAPSNWTTSNMQNNLVELIINNNVEFAFEQSNRYGYLSSKDDMYKDIIHIPKQYAQNKIYTINLAHIYVYDQNKQYGIKLPFTIDAYTYQITHNDFGIPQMAIDAACQLIGSEDIRFFVQIMNFGKELDQLLFDGNMLSLLYKYCSDEDIISILHGDEDDLVGYLDAPILEQSDFIKLLMEKIDFDEYTDNTFKILINGLGYVNILDILGNIKSIIDVSNLQSFTNISVPKNLLIANNLPNSFLPKVYINGKKLSLTNTNIYSTDSTCEIEFNQPVNVEDTDKLNLLIDINPQVPIIKITPSATNYILQLSDYPIQSQNQFDLYIKENVFVFNIKDWENNTIPYGYKKLSEDIKDSYVVIESEEDKIIFLFTNNSFGKELYIVPKSYSNVYKYVFTIDDNPNPSIYIFPTITTIHEAEQIPFLNSQSYEVYLNGKRLIEGISYNLAILNTTDHYVGAIVTIQDKDNIDYNNPNTVEIIISTSVPEDKLTGFVIDNKFGTDDNINNLWLYNLTNCYINGEYVSNDQIQYAYKDTFKTKIDIPNISTVELVSSIPSILNDVLTEYIDSNSKQIITKILNYLIRYAEPELSESMLIVTQYKNIYSSFVNDVIRDIIHKELSDEIHNYTEEELQLFLQDYKYKEQFDLIMNNQVFYNIPENFKFQNLYPDYIEVDSTINFDPRTCEGLNPTKIVFIRSIIEYILTTRKYFTNKE